MRIWRSLLAVAALCVFSFIGADRLSAQQKMAIFTGTSPIFGPVFIADTNGYFKDEGLDITVKAFTSGADASEGFRSGGAQFLIAADVPLIYQLVGGDAVLLGQFSQNTGMLIMMGKNTVQGPADLKGKKIGLVRRSGSEYMLKRYLESAGLGLKDVEMVNLAPFDQIPAMANGNVDALSTWKPFNLKVTGVAKDTKILMENGPAGYPLYSGIIVKRSLMTPENKKTIAGVMRALGKAVAWIEKEGLDGTVKVLAPYLKTSETDVREVIKDNKWAMTVDDNFKSAFTGIAGFLHEGGLTKSKFDWDKSVDFSIVREIDPKLIKN